MPQLQIRESDSEEILCGPRKTSQRDVLKLGAEVSPKAATEKMDDKCADIYRRHPCYNPPTWTKCCGGGWGAI